MPGQLLILGEGYSGGFIRRAAEGAGWRVTGVRRRASDTARAIDDPELPALIGSATAILASAPPDSDSGEDPILARFGPALEATPARLLYLSSTGVYGDTGGAVVDESAPVGTGRRSARTEADLNWQALGATVLRLPGIYGPGRSAFDQVRSGTARRIDRPGHRFNRIHVEDIAGATLAILASQADGIFNVVDDLPAEPRHVTEFACQLLGAPPPPLESYDPARLSPMARGFWSERRMVAGTRLARLTGYRLRYPDYKAGLTSIREGEPR